MISAAEEKDLLARVAQFEASLERMEAWVKIIEARVQAMERAATINGLGERG